MNDLVEQGLSHACSQISAMLPPVESLSDAEKRRIIRRYTAAIAGNFVNWMAGASICSRSIEARYAAEENVFVEIRDGHPSLLRKFARNSGAWPDATDFIEVEPLIGRIEDEVSNMSGLFLTALMGTLETTSKEFIPFLAKLSKSLGNEDLEYTDIHGEADVGHADQFRDALLAEAAQHSNAEMEITRSIDTAIDFLRGILTVH